LVVESAFFFETVARLQSVLLGGQLLYAAESRQRLRAYPNNLVVMRLSEKPEAKTAGQKRSEAWFVPR